MHGTPNAKECLVSFENSKQVDIKCSLVLTRKHSQDHMSMPDGLCNDKLTGGGQLTGRAQC